MLVFSPVNHLSGEAYNTKKIAEVCHEHGVYVFLDLSYAIGSYPVRVSEWEVDGAVWNSNKYLNSGAGSLGGIYVNEKNNKIMEQIKTKEFSWVSKE